MILTEREKEKISITLLDILNDSFLEYLNKEDLPKQYKNKFLSRCLVRRTYLRYLMEHLGAMNPRIVYDVIVPSLVNTLLSDIYFLSIAIGKDPEELAEEIYIKGNECKYYVSWIENFVVKPLQRKVLDEIWEKIKMESLL